MKTTRLVNNVTGVAVVALVALSLCLLLPCSAKDDDKALVASIEEYGSYIVKGTFSFLYSYAHPPKTEAELKARCKSLSEAFKYLKEQTKGAPAFVRRGMLSFVSSRQPHYRKYCTNTSSEASRKFVAATKCVMEKKFGAFKQTDSILAQTIFEIARRNYTDPSVELKQICCLLYTSKKHFKEAISPECNEHREIIEELIDEIINKESKLVCEDDDKLAKLCPKLEPLQFKLIDNYSSPGGKSSAGLVIYLIATLGEPNDATLLSD